MEMLGKNIAAKKSCKQIVGLHEMKYRSETESEVLTDKIRSEQ